MRLHVLPNPAGHVLLVGILDNLGKGACGAAIQSLNLMLGLAEGGRAPGLAAADRPRNIPILCEALHGRLL
jgi:N-acetyl-gamma-glutamyl-phosphate reductase